jgi:DNA polymerase-3 subunit alpha
MLAFSNVINQYGGYLRENAPVVVTGRLSFRDDKDPQIVINRARPISDFENGQETELNSQVSTDQTLYLRLPTEDGNLFTKVRAMLNMFPGNNPVVVYFEDTKVRRGSRCGIDKRLLDELANVLGKENVVVK